MVILSNKFQKIIKDKQDLAIELTKLKRDYKEKIEQMTTTIEEQATENDLLVKTCEKLHTKCDNLKTKIKSLYDIQNQVTINIHSIKFHAQKIIDFNHPHNHPYHSPTGELLY